MKKLLAIFAILAFAACDNASVAPAKSSSNDAGLTEAQVQDVVAKYIADNPKAIIASLEKYQQDQMKEQQAKAKDAVKNNRDRLLNDKHSAILNPKAKNYIVEFFDYNCGFCKRAAPTLTKLIAEEKDVKFVFIELPVLGPSSEIAAAAAVIVQQKRPEKYVEFHNKLMESNDKKDLRLINQIARDLDIRDINFADELKNPEIAAVIEANRALADDLGIRGTPAFVINDELVPGAVPYEQIKSVLKETSK